MSKDEILKLIYENPIEIGHWVGFKDLNQINNQWLRMFLFSTDDLTLQGHRGSYKTTTLSLFFAIHTFIKPNETVLFFRKADVAEVIRTTGNILQSACVKKIVNVLYDKDLKFTKISNWEINTNLPTSIHGASQLSGLGLRTSITGKHADIVVTDDIVNVNDRVSMAERESTKLRYQELQNIKNRGGRFINSGTPWHKDDAFTLMPKPIKYDCYSTGLMSEEDIAHVKSQMLPSLFAANYELRHIASEDVIFTDPVKDGDPAILDQARYCHVDAAYEGEDYTAFTIVKKTGGKYYVFGKLWRKHIDNCEDEIIMWRQRFNAGKIWCETNGDKGYLAKDLRRRGERVVSYHESMNKFLKITSYLKGVWKDVIFVVGTDPEYITQITDYNENAEHDDAPDSLASMIRELWGKRDEEERYKSIFDINY